MKNLNYLLSAFFLSAVITVAACGQTKDVTAPPITKSNASSVTTPSTDTDEIKADIEGKEFILKNAAGSCNIVFGDQTIDLGIPWRCDFHRSPEKAVRIFPRDFYSDRKKYPKNYRNTQIFLIEYSTSDPKNPKDCRTQLQAVKITDGKIAASKTPSKLASCPSFQWEIQNFTRVFE